jgi:hypothetical protein
VVKIESSISGGEFTQVLHGVRMNNQKGKGKEAIIGNILTNSLLAKAKKEADDKKDALNQKQKDILNNERKKELIKGTYNQFNYWNK